MKTHKWGRTLGFTLLGLLAFVPEASAYSNCLGGFAGHAQGSSNSSCFSENWGSVISSCASKPGWEVSMPTNSPGSYWTPLMHVYGTSGSGSITCGVNGVSNDRFSIYTAPQQTASTGAGMLSFSVWVPANGYLFAGCYMGNGSELYSVNW
jgi:hypothetical protein